MIDTLMAFWNQNRRKRAAQVMLTFFLMCISISLLFVVMSLPQWSHTNQHGSVAGRTGNNNTGGIAATTPTVIVQITQGPEMTPTSTINVPGQVTPTPASSASSCTTPDAQVNANATTYPNTFSQQATPDTPVPISQSASPVAHPTPTVTPSPTASPTIVPTATATPTFTITPTVMTTSIPTGVPTVTPTSTTSNGTPPHMPSQPQSGGGPINIGTPISASPVPGLTPTTGIQHIGGGWISACNGNDIGMAVEADMVSILWRHVWLILAASLACTALFYGIVYQINRKRIP